MNLFDESLFDENFIYSVKRLAKGLELPPALIVQNIVIAKLARDAAQDDVYGNSEKLLTEFMATTNSEGETHLMTGADLFDAIYQMEKDRLEREYVNTLAAAPWEVCSEKEKELLTRHGYGPVAEQKKAEEKKNIDELREKYNLPKRKPGQNSHWEE